MNLADVSIFVEAVRRGSLAGAARRLGIGTMTASRGLAALEQELGVRLLHRTTRSLSPTTEGERFLPHAQAMLEEQASGLSAINPANEGLWGMLRLTTSAMFGRKIVAPLIPEFMQDNPALQVDLLLTDEQVDIVGRGIDLALRIAKLRDNHLVARRLADNPRKLVAAPVYLSARGAPATMTALADHACLLSGGQTHWDMMRGGKGVRQRVSGRFTANSVEAILEACLGGLGIACLSGWAVDDAIRVGTLQEIVLQDAEVEPLKLWAVYPSARQIPARVRGFVDMLTEKLAG